MQTEVPVLPVVDSHGHKRSTRKTNGEIVGPSIESKNHTQCKSAQFLISNRNHLNPILGAPYKNTMRLHCTSEPTRRPLKNPVGQRIISAKTLRVKELQNQLTDAHYHLNELANENRLLKALQKRQDSALKRYEGVNAELPRIINSHHEELKVLQTKYKRLRSQHKQTCDLLKEKDNEIHSLQSQNKHLLQLSKDRHLGEREKLQVQVSDLNHRIEQQQETIQSLNRKLSLDSKSMKHQLHLEVTKHKDTQRQLTEALDKLKNLEELLDNRERRLHHSGQLPAFNKRKALTSQSLTNLGLSHLIKSSNKNGDSQSDFKNKSLPKLPVTDSSDSKPSSSKTEAPDVPVTETMASLHQIRKFRLQKSSHSHRESTIALPDCHPMDDDADPPKHLQTSPLNTRPAEIHTLYDGLGSQDLADEEIKQILHEYERKHSKKPKYHVSKELLKEYGYSTDSSSESLEEPNHEDLEIHPKPRRRSPTAKSRDLHSRLINGTIDSDFLPKTQKPSKLTKRLHHSPESDSELESPEGLVELPKGLENSQGLQKTTVKLNVQNSQERLQSLTKSWTDLKDRIKRGREIPETHLTSEKSPETEDTTSGNREQTPEKLLRYFERDDEVEREISESHNKSRRGTFGLDRPLFAEKNGDPTESDSLTGESWREPEVRRKSSDGVVEANIVNFREKNSANAAKSGVDKKGVSRDTEVEDRVSYNKEKLLAAMKAIDDNENIDIFPNQKTSQRSTNSAVRSQVTENLYRGIPTHARRRDDIIKDIFSDAKETKLRKETSTPTDE